MDWLTVATNFGLPTAGLITLSFGLYRGLVWFTQKIAEPVASRHIRFLDELSSATAAQSQAMQMMILQQTKLMDQVGELITMLEAKT